MVSRHLLAAAAIWLAWVLLHGEQNTLAADAASSSNSAIQSVEALAPEHSDRADLLVKRFEQLAKPVLSSFCFDCHNEDYNEGNVKLDILDPDMLRGEDAERWHAALDMVNSGEMPPAEGEQPSDKQRRALVDWITNSLDAARNVHRGGEQPLLRRLTKRQYANTLRDLLKLPIEFGEDLPDDSPSRLGFRNSATSQQITSLHYQNYEAAARKALGKAIVTGKRPEPFRVRVRLGKDIGSSGSAAFIGGYQSMPIDSDHVRVEILDSAGKPRIANSDEEKKELLKIERNIGVGMRGSAVDRYRVTNDGIVLDSALPHKEVTPKSWQGPSPNLKVLLRRCAPSAGPFRLRVSASKGAFSNELPRGLVSLRGTHSLVTQEDLGELKSKPKQIVVSAADFDGFRNVQQKEDALVAEDITKNCYAQAELIMDEAGLYQIDLVHPFAADAAMPSITLRIDTSSEHVRLRELEPIEGEPLLITPIAHASIDKGEHTLQIGGKFFVGLSHLVMTRLPDDHQVAQELANGRRRNSAKYADATPALRVFIGTRTDDGMEYATFGESTPVLGKQDAAETYEFQEYLENLPVPTFDALEQGDLSNIMMIGMWNDYLVKHRQDQGPLLRIEQIEFEAPYYPVWPPESHTAILFDDPLRESDLEAYTRRVLEQFMTNAFRRPVKTNEVERYYKFWQEVRGEFESYEQGVQETLVAVLCSPSFLYRDYPIDTSQPQNHLAQHQLATSLSYFLWNSPPDIRLLKLADEGELLNKRAETVEWMLQNPKATRFTQTFTEEWLRLDRHHAMTINPKVFPDYSRFVKRDMRAETQQFFHYALTQGMSARVLIDSEFAMLNQNLAEFYGVNGVLGAEFRPVPLDRAVGRGGLLSQGAFLVGHSDGTQSHPIKRAVWLQERILGNPPPPPPPNVPELDPDTPGFEALTLKEQLELHRNKASCVDCHQKIDPYGIVFEEYDAVGRRRTSAKGRPIDAASELPNGHQLTGVQELKDYILQEQYDLFLRSLCEHLFAYATGREITYIEQPRIDRLMEAAKKNDRLDSIVLSVVQCESFLPMLQSETPRKLAQKDVK